MAGKTRRPVTPKQQAEREAARQEKLEQLHEQLTTGVRALADGAQWQAWLRNAAKFHRYSFRNTLLIALQRPTATTVAGYEAWKTHGRQVTKGEKGIQILAPVLVRTDSEDKDKADAPAAEQRPGSQETAESNRPPRKLVNVRVAYVWDVSQTSGEPLPTQPLPQLLDGRAPEGMWDGLARQVAVQGYVLERGDCGDAEGWTNFATRTVRIREDVSDADAVATLAHELGHVLLHAPEARGQGTSLGICRGQVEVEAESYAFIVSAAHELPTDRYTFPYVAAWAASVPGAELDKVLTDTATRVLGAASTTLAVTLEHRDENVSDELAAAVMAGQERTAELRQRAEQAREAGGPPAATQDTAPLLAMQAAAAAWYAEQLGQHSEAGAYLIDRGIPSAMSTALRIGYAPAGWTGLRDHLTELGHTDEQIVAAGLGRVSSRGNVIDLFRDRIMFPHRDEHGTVVGFIGRTQSDDPNAPKYLNSPATAVYSKGRVLYGLAENRRALEAGATPVLCEGTFDALAVTLSGAGRYVGLAPSGTALTSEQVAALDWIVPLTGRQVLVAFDSDKAGQRASDAAWKLLQSCQAASQYASFTGKDPAALYETRGTAAVAEALARPRPLVELVISHRLDDTLAAAGTAASSIEKRVSALREVAPLVAELPPTATARQVSWLANRLGLGFDTVNATVLEAVTTAADAAARVEAAQRPQQVAATPRRTATPLLDVGRPRERLWPPLKPEDEAPMPTAEGNFARQYSRST